MKALATLTKWLAHLWVAGAVGVILLSCAGTMMTAESFWNGLKELWTIWSPFNLWNVFACFVLIAPAMGLYWLSDRIEERA